MSFLYAKSKTWRWIVDSSRTSRPFFYAFGTVCFVIPFGLGYCMMMATSYNDESVQEHLSKQARRDTQLAKLNKERLAQLLNDAKNKNLDRRYAAALRGEILTDTSGGWNRDIRGTSMQSMSNTNGDQNEQFSSRSLSNTDAKD